MKGIGKAYKLWRSNDENDANPNEKTTEAVLGSDQVIIKFLEINEINELNTKTVFEFASKRIVSK